MPPFNVAEAKARLSQLVPIRRTTRRRHPGSAKGRVTMSKDFGARLEDLREYR